MKLGIRVSPRTVAKYLRNGRPARTPDPKQRWLTFVHNHAKVVIACDFFVVTAIFRILYVFVVLELGSRRIVHYNVTAHPTAEWTLQQFREVLPHEHPYRFVIHDRDSIFSAFLDQQVTNLGVRVLRTPIRAPMANSVCERFGGTLRRERLDFLIPFKGAPPKDNRPDLGRPLQPRLPTLVVRTWDPGAEPGYSSDRKQKTRIANRPPRREEGAARRVAP